MEPRPLPADHAPTWSRRQVLQVGGISALGLTLPQLLKAGDSPPPSRGSSPSAGSAPRDRSCIFIVQYGGASQLDTLDPKPDAPAEIRGPFQPIATRTPGLHVCEHLPRLAALSDRCTIVRSMTHDNAVHDGAMHVSMTGHSRPTENTPYFGSIAAKVRPATRNVPSYVWIQNLAGDVQPRYLTGGFLGMAYSPLRVGTDLDNPSAPDFRVTAFDTPEGVSPERLRAQYDLFTALEPAAAPLLQADAGAAMRRFQEQAIDLVTRPEARRAFDLAYEPDDVRDRYGRHPLGQNLLMARRLIEAGVRLVNVVAWTGTAPGEEFVNVQTWDMHGPSAAPYIGSIFGNGSYGLGFALPRVDQAVSALLEDLDARGLLESTLVVMVGEFGRTPQISREGRDHWPACYSALLAGAGIGGGTVYGASDHHAAYVRDLPVTPENFGASLLHALGIPPETRLAPDGFTNPASPGAPILELFG